jgi:ribosomal protein S18 acetylase RimI-like enzyme
MRPPTDADAAAVLDLIVTCDIADLGAPDYRLADLQADWAAPGLELSRDGRLIDGDGALAAYALVTGTDDAFVIVRPQATGRGLGTLLRRWAEARAAERGVRVLRQYTYGSNDRARALLRAASYEHSQTYFRLRAELDRVPDPPPARLRCFAAGDEAAVHALVEEAFAEVEGNTPMSLERWRADTIAKDGWDPSLWLLLEDEGGLAGVVLGEQWPADGGFVSHLAVAPRARRRGHGRKLLLHVFAAFRRAGLTFAELSVHARNRGALHLYRSAGMEPTFETERWEKAIAPG